MHLPTAMALNADTSYEAIRLHLEQARILFGKNLSRWRRLNHWSQDTAETWANTAGFVVLHNSQQSKLERGLSAQPGPIVFCALGVLNERIANEDWGSRVPASLADRLRGSKPVQDEDGHVWTGADFYSSFIGEKPWPELPGSDRPITDAEASAWNIQFRSWFDQIRASAKLTLLQGLSGLTEHVPEEHQASMQNVVTGTDTYSAAQLERLRSVEGLEPELWLREWQASLNQRTALAMGDHWRFVHVERQAV